MEVRFDTSPVVGHDEEEAGGERCMDLKLPDPSEGTTILPPTRISLVDDVHGVVDQIGRAHAQALLRRHAKFGLRESVGLSISLSELTQNVVEHAESAGWATIWFPCPQTMCIVVLDTGVGFSGTLGGSDREALRAGVLDRCSRYRDPGRGQGLRYVLRWAWDMGASAVFRSGSARLAIGRKGMVRTEDSPWAGTMVTLWFGKASRPLGDEPQAPGAAPRRTLRAFIEEELNGDGLAA